MPLKASDYPPLFEGYTFVSDEGETIHIDSVKLRRWCLDNKELKIFHIPVERKVALKFINEKSVSLDRLKEMCEKDGRALIERRYEPIIYCRWKEGVDEGILVDGHHRYFIISAILNFTFIDSYILEPSQWRPFQIEGLRDFTREELLARLPAAHYRKR